MDASPVAPGQILAGKYRIERVLGEGGMGVVVEAMDTGLERRVAIKFLLPDFVKHAEAKERFLREARAAVKIQSEHVARVIDVSTLESGAPYMVMEFLEGSDLARVIETSGPLAVEDAALYVIQACEALAEAHAHGIIHRDLKPANLFLANQAGGSRKIKVLDFGISKTLTPDSKSAASLTRTSSMMGSPLYMSPEQMKSSRDVDHRTDIWALGVILYESLTGEPPFLGNSIPEISAKILLEDPRPLCDVRATVPRALSELVLRALHKQPDRRFANVSELALALLPFAPSRARGNAERISRVLEAAGMAKSGFQASVPPPPDEAAAPASPAAAEPAAPRLALPSESPAKRKQTLANWGQTHADGIPGVRRAGSRLSLGAAVGSVAGIGLLVTLVLKLTDNPAEPARAAALPPPAAAAAAPPAEPPKLAQQPAAEPADTAGAAQAAPPAAPEPRVAVASADEAPAVAEPSEPKPAAAPVKPRATARATTTATSKKPVIGARASVVAKPPEKTHSVDFKSKFGSRK